MKKTIILFLVIVLGMLLIGCDSDDNNSEEILLFEENFQGENPWIITGETDTSVIEPGSADGEVSGGALSLHASGCTRVTATLPLTETELIESEYDELSLKIDIEGFNASPIISSGNRIAISFSGFNLIIKPLQHFDDLLLTFNLSGGDMELATETEAIEYTFSTISASNQIYLYLQSQGLADCTATADLRLNSIEISTRQ